MSWNIPWKKRKDTVIIGIKNGGFLQYFFRFKLYEVVVTWEIRIKRNWQVKNRKEKKQNFPNFFQQILLHQTYCVINSAKSAQFKYKWL